LGPAGAAHCGFALGSGGARLAYLPRLDRKRDREQPDACVEAPRTSAPESAVEFPELVASLCSIVSKINFE
jgi:hypothetical protein